jgi:hypothetical protein
MLLHCTSSARAQTGSALPTSADLLLRGRPAEGLLILRSGLREPSFLSVDALVFADADSDLTFGGDVLVMSIELREPNGYGVARLGRFIMSTGAVRPVQIDGASVLGRAPTGTSLELFAGSPVVPQFGSRSFDWLIGTRAGQQLFDEHCAFGVSYLHRRDAGEVSDDELGVDVAFEPFDWLSFTALGAWDRTADGLAEARAAAIAHADRDQLELFVSQRVAARLLPATSLFSVISQAVGTQAGAAASWRAFPRLDLGASAALEGLDDDLGYSLGLRSMLSLSALDAGQLGFEGTRRSLGEEGWTGAAVQLWLPILAALRANASVEIVAADHPRQRGSVWPWLRAGASYGFASHWIVAAAVGVQATPLYRSETYGLLRVGYSTEVLP